MMRAELLYHINVLRGKGESSASRLKGGKADDLDPKRGQEIGFPHHGAFDDFGDWGIF
jgi:hypothetical protein